MELAIRTAKWKAALHGLDTFDQSSDGGVDSLNFFFFTSLFLVPWL